MSNRRGFLASLLALGAAPTSLLAPSLKSILASPYRRCEDDVFRCGVITCITMTNAGSGYTTSPLVSFIDPTGNWPTPSILEHPPSTPAT